MTGERADKSRARVAAADIRAVAIGASAGGVEALSWLLPALPADSRAAVFVVLHLPRDRPSLLVELFSHKCALEVREAVDKEPVTPGTVYFAPPNYHLLVDAGLPAGAGLPADAGLLAGAGPPVDAGPQLALSADDLVNHSRPSIDVLFESAAEVYREHLLGIILTGANEDGAAGLAAVHDAGGLTVVQEPGTAQSSAMILSALERRPVDLVLGLAGIAELLKGMCASEPRRRT